MSGGGAEQFPQNGSGIAGRLPEWQSFIDQFRSRDRNVAPGSSARASWHFGDSSPSVVNNPVIYSRASSSPTETDGPDTVERHGYAPGPHANMSLPPMSAKPHILRPRRPGDCIHHPILCLLHEREAYVRLITQSGLTGEQLEKLNEAMLNAFRCRARSSSQTAWSLCHEHNCKVWHELVIHEQKCVLAKRPDGGCRGVRELHEVARYHANTCTEAQCPVVFCRFVKTMLESSPVPPYSSQMVSLLGGDDQPLASSMASAATANSERGVPVPGSGKRLRMQVMAMSLGTKRSYEPFSLTSVAPSLSRKRAYTGSSYSPQLSLLQLGDPPVVSLSGKSIIPVQDEKEVLFACDKKHIPVTADGFCEEDVNWERVTTIGSGSFGRCLLCRPLSVDRSRIFTVNEYFVVKVVEWRHEVIEEIRLWSILNHPHILPLWGAVRINKRVFMYTEFMVGMSVADMLIDPNTATPQPLEELHALSYLDQVLQALDYMHRRGILHRDVKGRNVLLADPDGLTAKLADFGTALDLRQPPLPGGSQVVSQPWMSPEVARNEDDCEQSSRDIWAAGCFLYEMLVAQPPWHQFSVGTLIYMIGTCSLSSCPKLPDSTSRWTQQLYARMLDLDRRERPSASSLLESLKGIFNLVAKAQSFPISDVTGSLNVPYHDQHQEQLPVRTGDRLLNLSVTHSENISNLRDLHLNEGNLQTTLANGEELQARGAGAYHASRETRSKFQELGGEFREDRAVQPSLDRPYLPNLYQTTFQGFGAYAQGLNDSDAADSTGQYHSMQSDYAADGPLTEEEFSGKLSSEDQGLLSPTNLSASASPEVSAHFSEGYGAHPMSPSNPSAVSPSIPIPRRGLDQTQEARRRSRPLSVTESFLSRTLVGGMSAEMIFPSGFSDESFDGKQAEETADSHADVPTLQTGVDSTVPPSSNAGFLYQSNSLPYQPAEEPIPFVRTPHTAPVTCVSPSVNYASKTGSVAESARRSSLSDLTQICSDNWMTPDSHKITKVTLCHNGKVLNANVPKPSTFAEVALNSYDPIQRLTGFTEFTLQLLSRDNRLQAVPSNDRVADYGNVQLSVLNTKQEPYAKVRWYVSSQYGAPKLTVIH